MITLYQLIDKFRTIAIRHYQIESYFYGEYNRINENTIQPGVVMLYDCVGVASSQAQITYDIQVTILDIPNTKLDNRLQIESKALDIINDVVNEFIHGREVVNEADKVYQLITQPPFEPVELTGNNAYIGWTTTLQISALNQRSGCDTPYKPAEVFNLQDNAGVNLLSSDGFQLQAI